eukprot:TRINITY_DN7957_c0_g1_i6.p1 TRINITY_DN7957_c0_g1~~TRINITY_DN7957_c0_g1_i6.p1  ORF type:complete len:477 (-),score=138.00 TRINITY_DN7957_c0_g1_i6:333-1763(-)
MVKVVYKPGDLVFAKVRGYAPWPAKITDIKDKGPKAKFHVFFYGTYESAILKHNELYPFNNANLREFVNKNHFRKNYTKGIADLLTNPDLAPGPKANPLPGDLDDLETIISTPGSQNATDDASSTANSNVGTPSGNVSASPMPRKPYKISDGTPTKRPAVPADPQKAMSAPTPGRRQSQRSSKDEPNTLTSPTQAFSTPQTSSRSGRVIKQKRFGYEDGASNKQEAGSNVMRADSQIDDPRKIWVKRKSTGDMIEISLDKEKPTVWQSERHKLSWNMAAAHNAMKLKKAVELGQFIPEELIQELKAKTELTEEEKQDLRRAAQLKIRREKLAWLRREDEMLETDFKIKKALQFQNPDIEEGVKLLQKLLQLEVESFMLVKNPQFFDTLLKLKRYNGPKLDPKQPNPTRPEKEKRHIESIQTMADTMSKKVMALFTLKKAHTPQSFFDFIQERNAEFLEKTKNMQEQKRLLLTEMPN